MPRENSFSDSDGRSLTPDLDDFAADHPERPTVPAIDPGHPTPTPAPAPKSPTSPKSPKSPRHPIAHHARPPAVPHRTPGDKFRASVRKVIQLHRTSTMMIKRGGVGAEPGIDPRRDDAYLNWGHIRQNCEIEVVDYSSVRSENRRMSNSEFVNLMSNADDRPAWSKVRWINIGGISWDVLSALAIKYELHPLALEDLLTNRGHSRSKADYYTKHLALRILCHAVVPDEDTTSLKDIAPEKPRSSSPIPMSEDDEKALDEKFSDEGTMYGGSPPISRFSTKRKGASTMRRRGAGHWTGDIENSSTPSTPSFFNKPSPRPVAAARGQWDEGKVTEALKQGERVNVKIDPMHIFLRRDGTVISVHPNPDLVFTSPIAGRLRQRDTGLRASADPSLLLQSLLDLIVDSALQVVDEYQGKIMKLEQSIMLKPKMKTVRYLHVMSGDLILHKRTLEPIKTLIYGLRRYDRDRCAALIDMDQIDPLTGQPPKVVGYMSHKATIYMADVFDHMEHILTSLDMFTDIAENLINYTFNMVSNDMNEVMRRLTLATIIFLPLTLLTGYFGMNFEFMFTIQHGHSDLVFWIIALPVMAIVLPIFLWEDCIRMVHYLKKRSILAKIMSDA